MTRYTGGKNNKQIAVVCVPCRRKSCMGYSFTAWELFSLLSLAIMHIIEQPQNINFPNAHSHNVNSMHLEALKWVLA